VLCFPLGIRRKETHGCPVASEHGTKAYMIALRSFILTLVVALVPSVASHAQAPAASPPGISEEQFDALVNAISKSVVERLKAEG